MEWDPLTILGSIIAVLSFIFGYYKWSVARRDKHKSDINNLQDQKLKEQAEKLRQHAERLNALEELIRVTREEMPKIKQIEKIEESLFDNIERIHTRITGLSKDLNQALGAMKGNHESEISNVLEQIRTALERK